jgi:hypothetical protein
MATSLSVRRPMAAGSTEKDAFPSLLCLGAEGRGSRLAARAMASRTRHMQPASGKCKGIRSGPGDIYGDQACAQARAPAKPGNGR